MTVMSHRAPNTRLSIRTVLFDLDGTLLDTAPDLAYALNALRGELDLPPLPLSAIRPAVSHGGTALVRLGFDLDPDAPGFAPMRERFLHIYRENLCRGTRPFPGMDELLEHIEARGMNWGVVTNKPAWLTDPLLQDIGLAERAACIVSGDTISQRKPHPAPMLHACGLAGSKATECVYVGDAARDIEAGRNAGMHTLVALFGYIGADDDPLAWGANDAVREPGEILAWIEQQEALRA